MHGRWGEPVFRKNVKALDPGFDSEFDSVDEREWYRILEGFSDANIFQTWAYGAVTAGPRNIAHMLLKENGHVVAIAEARIAKLPGLPVGIAYVRWGPLWRRYESGARPDVFRQAVRALRNEFACGRGLVVRLLPLLFDSDDPCYGQILAEEGFSRSGDDAPSRTILMDLGSSLGEIREGMRAHWKRELKVAERKALEVVEGSGDELFEAMIEIHGEMLARKKFVEGSDINQFRQMQGQLPDRFKLGIMLCRSDLGPCAGLVWSAVGAAAIYLFGATGNVGMKSNGAYLLHWQLIERLKREGRAVYDLNGVNAVNNPGTYKFKADLAGINGREVAFLGQFESCANAVSRTVVGLAEGHRSVRKRVAQAARLRKLTR